MASKRRLAMLGTLICLAAACSNPPTLIAARGYTLIGIWQSTTSDQAKFFSTASGTLLVIPCLRIETGPVALDDSLSFSTVGAVVESSGLALLKVGDTVTVAGVAASHTLDLSLGASAHYTMKTASASLSKNNYACNQ